MSGRSRRLAAQGTEEEFRVPEEDGNLKRGASSRAGNTAKEPSISVWKKTSRSNRASWQPGKPGEWRLTNGEEGAVGDEPAGAARRGQTPGQKRSRVPLRMGRSVNQHEG